VSLKTLRNRRGLGKGRGSGWKNIIASDSYRHTLSKMGIKNAVSITKTQRRGIKTTMLPLLVNNTLSGYNLVENPRAKPFERYQMIYSHDVIQKHRDFIIDELKRRNFDYYVIPRESQFLDAKAFVKRPSQIRKKDIVTNKNKYQIVIDIGNKELQDFEKWLKRKAVNWNEHIQFFDGLLNPLVPIWEVLPFDGADTTPDIRIRNRARFPEYKKVTKITKKLDKNSDLVILSVRKENTNKIRKILKGETAEKVLVQNYSPEKHSLYKFIKDSTKRKSVT